MSSYIKSIALYHNFEHYFTLLKKAFKIKVFKQARGQTILESVWDNKKRSTQHQKRCFSTYLFHNTITWIFL